MDGRETRPDAVVQAVGLTKVFADFWGRPKARAVNGIDLHVRPGQVFGLLGPNGSGKSTTVKLMLGLLYPTRGSLTVLGEAATDVATKRRIGYLPEESYLYRYLTAAETLDFFGALFGIHPQERRKRCDQLLEMVGLTNARNRAVGEFSKGMARRIGLAQALVNDPDLVLLDEPTSGLDPIGCREVKDLIRLLAARGKTVVLSSHLLADVEDVCDEVVILYGGKIRAQGSLKAILTQQDKTRITAPRLDGPAIEKVLAVLREHFGSGNAVKVDQPSMNLEDFFLEVVRRAKEASLETAGAQSGGRIAAYLQGTETGGEAEATRQQLLQALAEEKVAEPSAQDVAAGTLVAAEPEPVTDQARLAALTPRPQPEASEATAAPARSQAAPSAATSERLQNLLQDRSSPHPSKPDKQPGQGTDKGKKR